MQALRARLREKFLDMVTMDEVVEDLAVREFASRTDLYGEVGLVAVARAR